MEDLKNASKSRPILRPPVPARQDTTRSVASLSPSPSPPDRRDAWQRSRGSLGFASWPNLSVPQPSSPPAAPTFTGRRGSAPLQDTTWQSNILYKTQVLQGELPRAYYLNHPEAALAPSVGCSPFVPTALITHLMRNKPDARPADPTSAAPSASITPMEAVYHAFVTPIVHAKLHGHCRWHGGVSQPANPFSVRPFAAEGGLQMARLVAISAQVPLDYSQRSGMFAAACLGEQAVNATPLPVDFAVPTPLQKAQPATLLAYEQQLRLHLVHHLTRAHRLEARAEVAARAIDEPTLLTALEKVVLTNEDDVLAPFVGTYLRVAEGCVLAIEMLLAAAIEQACIELTLLEQMAPQGYVYTYEVPSHVTGELSAALLARLHCAALKQAVRRFGLPSLRIYAFDSKGEPAILPLLHEAVANQRFQALVIPMADLFDGDDHSYRSFLGTHEKLLVLHTYANPFAQATEAQGDGTSQEVTLGAHSSLAASLARHSPHLLRRVYSPASLGAHPRPDFLNSPLLASEGWKNPE